MNFKERRPLCNNDPSAAPVICGKTFYLCWRCCGAVIGILFFLLINVIRPFMDIKCMWVILLASPAIIDYSMNRIGVKKASNVLRFITGLCVGNSVAMIEIIVVNYLRGI